MPTCASCGTSYMAGQLTCLVDGHSLGGDVPAGEPVPHPAAALASGQASTVMASGPGLSEVEPERLAAGTKVGDYQIEALVGAGAMGDVYRATHPVIGKQVAIKVIKRRHAATGEALERFVREARAVNKIDHPNVVDVFGMGRLDDGRIYLVMDLLEGESLGAFLRKHGAMPPHEILEVLRPVCEAVAAAHEHGIVHRDLKPDNVFLEKRKPFVRLLDFGIAKVVAEAGQGQGRATLTSEGAWVGTPCYMAPEQWASETVTAQTDVYALGVMTYELLAGKPPYLSTSYSGLMEQHFRGSAPALADTVDGTPPELGDAVAAAMARRPEDRPAGALAFLALLERALGASPQGGRAVGGARELTPVRRRPATPWLVFAAGALVVAVIGGLVALPRLRGKPAAAAPAGVPATGSSQVEIESTPTHAEVRHGDAVLGTTPLRVELPRGQAATLVVRAPGYLAGRRVVMPQKDQESVAITLGSVDSFKGYWKLPSGPGRFFAREGDRVAGYSADLGTGDKTLLRVFEFRPSVSDDRVVFVATLDHVDEVHASEPSCHIPLSAEYRYQPASDLLELRLEQARYHFDGQRCVSEGGQVWGEWQAATRVTPAAFRTLVVSSGAGAGNLNAKDAVVSGPGDKTVNTASNALKPSKIGKKSKLPAQLPQKQQLDQQLKKQADLQQQQSVQQKLDSQANQASQANRAKTAPPQSKLANPAPQTVPPQSYQKANAPPQPQSYRNANAPAPQPQPQSYQKTSPPPRNAKSAKSSKPAAPNPTNAPGSLDNGNQPNLQQEVQSKN